MVKKNRQAVFITPHNIYDLYGNGGVKATQRNYELIKDILVREMCICAYWVRRKHQ